MEAVILSHDKKNDWDEFVYAHPNTISWHVFDFYKVIENNYQIIYYPLAVYDAEKICGILPLYHVRTNLIKDILISCPYVVAGGIIADNAAVRKTLLDKAIELANQIAKRAPLAVQLGKEAVNQAFETPLKEGLAEERRAFYSLFATEDQKEGMQAFLEKRDANWKGK